MKSLASLTNLFILLLIVNNNFILGTEDGAKATKKKSWKEKDIQDMNDADLEHLLEQWEENDDPLEPDELPEYLRPSAQIDISKLDMSDKDNVLRMTKKGKGTMMFVNVRPEISVNQADIVMRIWHTSLQNNHIIAERYPLEDRRCIFMFPDGSQAVDAKNFLVQQPELLSVTLEGQNYEGQYTPEDNQKETTKAGADRSEL